MKRASSANKNQDFKRLKAKVGKRAPKKLSETDTKFKSAKVKVQSQTIANGAETTVSQHGDMVSSRGKHFSQLMSQLNHPAANARNSAVQGMKDVIKHTPANIIPQHLALIVTSLSKCFVDEDSDVRRSAMTTLFDDVSPKLASCNMAGSMKPFLQLILAYIGSALHSLDQDVRYDGCKALEMACSTYQDLFLDGGDEITKLQATISAFTILFDDVSGGLASMSRRGVGSLRAEDEKSDATKKKQKQSKNSLRGVGVLKSFLAVNRITTTFQHGYDVLGDDLYSNLGSRNNDSVSLPSISKPDLVFLPGGRSSNAILWNKNQTRYAPKTSNIGNLLCEGKDSADGKSLASSKIDMTVQYTLFTKLRDRLVEISQRGQSGEIGIYLSSTDAEECSLIVKSIRLLWMGHCRDQVSSGGRDKAIANDSTYIKLKSTSKSVLSLFLECFPVKDASGKSYHSQVYDLLNASTCLALSELGSVLDSIQGSNDANNESEWVQAIFLYVMPQLGSDFTKESASASSTRYTLISVIEQLLIQPENGNHMSSNDSTSKLDDKQSKELVTQFGNAYFTPDSFDDSVCRSEEGRKAVALLILLIKKSLAKKRDEDMEEALMQMTLVLPRYLLKWCGSFPRDTAVVLATLLALARNCDEATNEEDGNHSMSFCNSLRPSLQMIFATSNKSRKIGSSESNVKAKVSVFEELSHPAQTLLLSLIGVLKHPSDEIMISFAQICSRRYSKPGSAYQNLVLSDAMIDYLNGVVHSMNRTITLQQYLTFLVNSCGIHSAKRITNDEEDEQSTRMINSNIFEFVCEFDRPIARMCRYLLLTKSKNAFVMLMPVLSSWLISPNDDELSVKVLKIRAALALISCHFISMGPRSVLEMLEAGDLKTSLIHAIYALLRTIPFSSENDDGLDLRQMQKRIVMPMMILFEQSSEVFEDILRLITAAIVTDDSASITSDNTEKKEHLLQWLVSLIKSKRLISLIHGERNVANQVRESAETIERSTAGGPLHAASGTFTMQVKVLLGFNHDKH